MRVQYVESRQLMYHHRQIHVTIEASLTREDHQILIEILPAETITIIIIIISIVEDQHLIVNRDTCYVLYFVSNKL